MQITPGASWRRVAIAALFACAFSSIASAAVRLHPLFTDHAVLQQGIRLPVWGTATDGESVTVEFAGQTVRAVASNGTWRVELRPLRANGTGQTLRVSGRDNRIELQDVVVGEVWVASGQSNMEWPGKLAEPKPSLAAPNPSVRLFTVAKRRANEPKTDLDYAPHHWEISNNDNIQNFSAVGWFFGRDLAEALAKHNVPVGVIHTSWGGSPAEVWMREDFLRADPAYSKDIVDKTFADVAKWQEAVAKWDKEKAEAAAAGKEFKANRPGQPWRAAELYNGMIANIIPYGIKGAIWYQGESNAGRAWEYRRLYADMIRNWRHDWAQGDFWFFCVQLAPWDMNRKRPIDEIAKVVGDSAWAELREAQAVASTAVGHAGVAVITDVGDKDDIHPRRKEPVGHRLALLAEGLAYGQKAEWSGPAYRKVTFKKGEARVRFTHASGLKTLDGGAPLGFTVAGADKVFHHAVARIDGSDTVVVSCPDVSAPVAVRYGWNDYPVVNLANGAGLPASPFRTDDFPMTTQPKK
jgi:sialate O-acetylesterase